MTTQNANSISNCKTIQNQDKALVYLGDVEMKAGRNADAMALLKKAVADTKGFASCAF